MAKPQTHDASDREDKIVMGSEKSFGIVFAVVFMIVALWPLWGGGAVRLWAVAIAATFLILGFVFPRALRPLNILWFKFGLLLGRIMTPIVMGFLFLVTFIPIGLILRGIAKKDLLRLKMEPESTSYWIKRTPPGPEPDTMENQF
ncbi:MAG: SxtJ family membrane protein [Pseudomonadota bacterium]